MAAVWPSASIFSEAIQNPQICLKDPELKGAQVISDNALGLPFASTGQFAVVFKLQRGNKPIAVRCFTRPLGDRERRYELINDTLDQPDTAKTGVLNRLASFEYDREGILVRGNWYPTLVMEWIDGITLDVCIEQLVSANKTDGLQHLATEFAALTHDLKAAALAHGDLQHGNILVLQDLSMKLVDLDGMYVPKMKGFKAAELGHRDFQHPKRTADFFDESIDDFSFLVIYSSLLAVAKDPSLWRFHKEGLLFSQSDFEAPNRSLVFKELIKLGGEIERVTEALRKACIGGANQTPSAKELTLAAQPTSGLPSWMRPSPNVSVTISSRAAQTGATGAPPGFAITQVAGTPGWIAAPSSPSTAPTSTAPCLPTPAHSRWKTPFLYFLTGSSCLYFADTTRSSLLFFIGAYLVWSGFKSWKRRGGQATLPSQVLSTPSGAPGAYAPAAPASKGVNQLFQPYATSISSSVGPFIGSRSRGIFHRSTCEWARRIAARNKITFPSANEAQRQGYRRCQVCNP